MDAPNESLAATQPAFQQRSIKVRPNFLTWALITPDDKYILSVANTVVECVDLETGDVKQRFTGHERFVRALTLTKDGKRLITGGEDMTIRIWDVALAKQLEKFVWSGSDSITAVSLAPDEGCSPRWRRLSSKSSRRRRFGWR